MTLAIDRLHLAAAAIAATHPEAAALLRRIATGAHPPTPDPNALKRTVLRRLWRQHHAGLERCPAAMAIAAAWRAFVPTGWEPPLDTPAAAYDRLHRLGARPLAWRTIADLLDADLD
jgi:hypothetical protein